jgi:hypothetical protein
LKNDPKSGNLPDQISWNTQNSDQYLQDALAHVQEAVNFIFQFNTTFNPSPIGKIDLDRFEKKLEHLKRPADPTDAVSSFADIASSIKEINSALKRAAAGTDSPLIHYETAKIHLEKIRLDVGEIHKNMAEIYSREDEKEFNILPDDFMSFLPTQAYSLSDNDIADWDPLSRFFRSRLQNESAELESQARIEVNTILRRYEQPPNRLIGFDMYYVVIEILIQRAQEWDNYFNTLEAGIFPDLHTNWVDSEPVFLYVKTLRSWIEEKSENKMPTPQDLSAQLYVYLEIVDRAAKNNLKAPTLANSPAEFSLPQYNARRDALLRVLAELEEWISRSPDAKLPGDLKPNLRRVKDNMRSMENDIPFLVWRWSDFAADRLSLNNSLSRDKKELLNWLKEGRQRAIDDIKLVDDTIKVFDEYWAELQVNIDTLQPRRGWWPWAANVPDRATQDDIDKITRLQKILKGKWNGSD